MTYWIVLRERESGNGVRVGVSSNGKAMYVYRPGAELRLADEASANAFRRIAMHAGLKQYAGMLPTFKTLEVTA